MIVSPKSAEAALKASRRALLKPGRWYPARISEATEKQNKAGTRDMIELLLVVTDDGQERELRDWLVDAGAGVAKLRAAVVAVDALDRYESGHIEGEDFAGRDVSVRVGIRKGGRGFADANFGPAPQICCNDFGYGCPMIAIPAADIAVRYR